MEDEEINLEELENIVTVGCDNQILCYDDDNVYFRDYSIPDNNIVFSLREKIWTGFEYEFSGESKEVLKITPEGFYCFGKRVDDIDNIYEKFSNWMNSVIQQ